VLQGISVYYCAFSYGGVSFAVLEDRKFKNTNKFGVNQFGAPLPPDRDLLGKRQEAFLAAWAGLHPGQPKICLTQTLFACVQTDPAGRPVADPDSNGAPADRRRAALQLLTQAGAVVLSGDQHLGSLVRHGIDAFTDGPVQFTSPAAGSAFQRWFRPDAPLPNASGPDTGDFVDGFGNRFRVLAVANPRVSYADVMAVQKSNNVGDRRLKQEGYGLVEVDRSRGEYRLNCWPWQQDVSAPGAAQYPGWPYVLPFSAV
jgi:alkaline phosphatase D